MLNTVVIFSRQLAVLSRQFPRHVLNNMQQATLKKVHLLIVHPFTAKKPHRPK